MRILLLVTDFYTRGGVARYSATLAAALGECVGEENVEVLALLDWGSRADSGVRVAEVIGSEVDLASKVRYIWRAWRRARQGYDLVVATHVGVAPVAALIRRCYGSPYWVACHGSEVWGRLSRRKWAALQAAERLLPVSRYTAERLWSVHGLSPLHTSVLYNAIPARFTQELTIDDCQLSVDSIIHCLSTNGDSGDGLSDSPPWKGGGQGVVDQPVRWRAHHPLTPSSTEEGTVGLHPFLLSVGGVSKAQDYKGVDQVIRALSRILAAVPAAHYVVVGGGDNRLELERLAEREGVGSHVRFVGEVGDAELAGLYRACDVFVMPSRVSENAGVWTGEGFGRVYVEAALAGKPVVGSRDGGGAEAILDRETGFAVNPESIDEIAAAVVRLLTNSGLAAAMGRRGRSWARENFTQPAMRGVLEQMLEPHGARKLPQPSPLAGEGARGTRAGEGAATLGPAHVAQPPHPARSGW